MSDLIPAWSLPLLRSPATGEPLHFEGERLLLRSGREVGRIEQGIVRLPMGTTDQNITAYKTVGGAHFFERSQVPFAMSALETPVYHDYLDDLKPDEPDAVIVDV